jgi:hypothetical protein
VGLPAAWLAAVLLAAPRKLAGGVRALAAGVLVRFSGIALWSVVTIAVTGLARAAGDLASPEQF